MAWWNKTESNQTAFGRTSLELPKTGKDETTLNIILFLQSTLDTYWDLVKEKAGGNEIQMHYRGVQLFFRKPDGRTVLFTIPTVFFNMPQEVTTGSVVFNLDEVAEISQQVKPISDALVSEILKSFPVDYFKSLGCEVAAEELEMGSLHRHPGNFSFSGIDLDNKAEDPGVIFRNYEATGKHQVDSVMYIPGASVQLVTTQTRIVDVKPVENNGGISGTYLSAPTTSYVMQDKVRYEDFGDFFKEGSKEEVETKITFKVDQHMHKKDYSEIEDVLTVFLENMEYNPELIIDPELITSRTYGHYGTAHSRYGRYGKHTQYQGVDDDYYDDIYGNVTVQTPVKKVAPVKTKPAIEARPTWRKIATLNLLRTKGIQPEKNISLTGSATDSDIIAVVTEMKNNHFNDTDIREFFKQAAYPAGALEVYYAHMSKDK